jgi:hypothetical protein
LEIVPAHQCRDLPDLVGLGLTLLRLEVDEFGDTRSREHPVATSTADLPKAQGLQESDEIAEGDVSNVSPANSFEQSRRLH